MRAPHNDLQAPRGRAQQRMPNSSHAARRPALRLAAAAGVVDPGAGSDDRLLAAVAGSAQLDRFGVCAGDMEVAFAGVVGAGGGLCG